MIGATEPQQPLTQEQKQFLLLAAFLKKQRDDQVKLSAVGAVGIGLLGVAAYVIWRRS